MPNWVYNRLRITGNAKERQRFVDEVVKEKFSFQNIKPRPKELDITSGIAVDNGRDILKAEQGDWSGIEEKFAWPAWTENVLKEGMTLQEKRDAMLTSMRPNLSDKDMAEAKQSIENEVNYGCKDWYQWNNRHWGTKWDAGDVITKVNKTSVYIEFDTAWSPPFPIIDKLNEMFPKLKFSLRFREECDGHFSTYENEEIY